MRQRGSEVYSGGWLRRLLRGDMALFEDAQADPGATVPALAVVIGASLLSGLGSWLWWVFQTDVGRLEVFLKSFLIGGLLQVLVWLVWVYVAYQVLTIGFGTMVSFYGMVRAMGFAFVPMGLMVLMAVPQFTVPLAVIAIVATVLLSQLALQVVTDYDAPRAAVANLIGFAVFALVMGVLANIAEVRNIGGVAPGLFFFDLN
jgi:hypothetical protein